MPGGDEVEDVPSEDEDGIVLVEAEDEGEDGPDLQRGSQPDLLGPTAPSDPPTAPSQFSPPPPPSAPPCPLPPNSRKYYITLQSYDLKGSYGGSIP